MVLKGNVSCCKSSGGTYTLGLDRITLELEEETIISVFKAVNDVLSGDQEIFEYGSQGSFEYSNCSKSKSGTYTLEILEGNGVVLELKEKTIRNICWAIRDEVDSL